MSIPEPRGHGSLPSPERVRIALLRGQPDRVPVIETGVDPRIAAAVVPGCLDVADCLDRLGCDAVSASPVYRRGAPDAQGCYADEWGVTYQKGPEMMDHPVRGPLRTHADVVAYRPPDPDEPGRLGRLRDMVKRYKGRRAIRFSHRAAFMWSAYLMDMDNLLANMLVEPETVHLLMDKVLETNIKLAVNAIRAGAEIVTLGDDYAHNHGPLMSPECFAEFIQPRLKRMVDAVHEEGALVVKHSDGNLYPILEAIVSTGVDCINPIEPLAGMDLKTVKQRVGDRVSLCGNIDCGQLLPHGTVQDVIAAVRKAVQDAGAGGGFLLASSNSIHSSCRPENYAAMVAAGLEYGRYEA